MGNKRSKDGAGCPSPQRPLGSFLSFSLHRPSPSSFGSSPWKRLNPVLNFGNVEGIIVCRQQTSFIFTETDKEEEKEKWSSSWYSHAASPYYSTSEGGREVNCLRVQVGLTQFGKCDRKGMACCQRLARSDLRTYVPLLTAVWGGKLVFDENYWVICHYCRTMYGEGFWLKSSY